MTRVGLIGYGYAARTYHVPLIRRTPGLDLAAVAVREPGRFEGTAPARVVDRDALLADPGIELVVVATPSSAHVDLALAALGAGKHVVVEKPFALSLDEARRLRVAADRSGRVLTVFHNRRWDGDFLTVRRLLAAGAVGEPMELISNWDRYRPEIKDRWRERDEPGSGLWFDLGVHLVDQALQLFGPPQEVSADIAAQRPGAVVDDYFQVRLSYGRLRVTLRASSLASAPSPRFHLHGARASFVSRGFDRQEADLVAQGHGGVDDPVGALTTVGPDGPRTEPVALDPGDYGAFYRLLARALADGTPPPVLLDEAADGLRVLEAARESARTGRTIPLGPRH